MEMVAIWVLEGSYTALPQTKPNANGANSSARPHAGACSRVRLVVEAIGTRHIVVAAATHTAVNLFIVLIVSQNKLSKDLLVRWTQLAAHLAKKLTCCLILRILKERLKSGPNLGTVLLSAQPFCANFTSNLNGQMQNRCDPRAFYLRVQNLI